MKTPLSPPVQTSPDKLSLTGDQQKLSDALDQLKRSERGRRAAVAFRKFLLADEGSAFSLDSENQRAIETLASSCRIFGASNVVRFLPKK